MGEDQEKPDNADGADAEGAQKEGAGGDAQERNEDELVAELEALRSDVQEMMGKMLQDRAAEQPKEKVDEALAAIKEQHPDLVPVLDRIERLEKQLSGIREAAEDYEQTRYEKELLGEIREMEGDYRLTPKEIKTVLRALDENPSWQGVLTFREAARRTFGESALEARRAKGGAGHKDDSDQPPRTIITDRAGGGKLSKQEPFNPGPGSDFRDIALRAVNMGKLRPRKE